MQEVGGSIPPGSATLRPSAFTWRSHVMAEGRSVVPGVAPLGEDGLETLPDSIYPCSVRVVGYAWRATRSPKAKRARRSPLGRRRAGDADVVRLHHPQRKFSRTRIYRRNRRSEPTDSRPQCHPIPAHRKIQTLEIGLVLRFPG